MQHITMLVGINDDGDENNDVLFENRDVVSSLVVETELRVLVVTSGDHYHQLGPRDTVWGTFTLSTFHFHSWALEILSGGILSLSHFYFHPFTLTLSQLGPGDTVWWHPFTFTLSL